MINSIEKFNQLEHRKRLMEYAEKTRQEKRRNALVFQVGEIVLECWPWATRFTVRHARSENEAEFAPLRDLLLKISDDIHYTKEFHVLQQKLTTNDDSER